MWLEGEEKKKLGKNGYNPSPSSQSKILTHSQSQKGERRDVLSSITREREKRFFVPGRTIALGKTHLFNSVWALSLFAARAFSLPLLSTLTPHFLFCFSDGDFRHHPTASVGHTWPMCDSLIPILIPGRFFFLIKKSLLFYIDESKVLSARRRTSHM